MSKYYFLSFPGGLLEWVPRLSSDTDSLKRSKGSWTSPIIILALLRSGVSGKQGNVTCDHCHFLYFFFAFRVYRPILQNSLAVRWSGSLILEIYHELVKGFIWMCVYWSSFQGHRTNGIFCFCHLSISYILFGFN